MQFFTADLHLGHAGVIGFCNRPFASADEMDAALIANWNRAIKRGDDVFILGDFTMKPAEDAHRYLSALNGRKYMIRGNHDKFLNGFGQYAADFEWVKDYFVLRRNRQAFVLFHFPIAEWAEMWRGSIHLYGHVHNSEMSAGRVKGLGAQAVNVGVDVNDYRPVSIEEILERVKVSEGSG